MVCRDVGTWCGAQQPQGLGSLGLGGMIEKDNLIPTADHFVAAGAYRRELSLAIGVEDDDKE